MKLTCKINDTIYENIVTGVTFSEEYNETLDSGTIILDHIAKIADLRPYDDVFIWNSDDNFNGYFNIGDEVFFNALENSNFELTANYDSEGTYTSEESATVFFEETDSSYVLSGEYIGLYINLVLQKDIDYNQRYQLFDSVSFQLTLLHSSGLELTANYFLPLSGGFNPDEEPGILHLGRTPPPDSPAAAPSSLIVSYRIVKKEGRDYYRNPYQYYVLEFDKIVNYEDENHEIKPVKIISIELVPGHDYSYLYNDTTNLQGTLSLQGITQEELLTLKNVTMTAMFLDFRYYDLRLSEVIENGSGDCTLRFSYARLRRPPLYPSFYTHIDFRMTQQNDGTWQSELTDLLLLDDDDEDNARYVISDVSINMENALITVKHQSTLPKFFKHMLVDSYSAEMVDLDKENYKYKIDLMSETKALEKVILPNISITQPIVGEKRTILYYLKQYVDLYSPKIKIDAGNGEWKYINKYKIDERIASQADLNDEYLGTPVSVIFGNNLFAPELSLTTPNLRELLSALMIVKDCIPVVKNNVVYAMDVSKKHGDFVIENPSKNISFIEETMNSENYSTAYRREYEGAISQKSSAHRVEYLGFRNSENALMTLENMYLETQFPIYKINKLYMCYYKRIKVRDLVNDVDIYKLVLIKQDISSLVLENVVRNTLAADWTQYPSQLTSFSDMSKYRILTVGYDIGSNKITGWGENFSYIKDWLGWQKVANTYLETIMNYIDGGGTDSSYSPGFSPYGIGQEQFLEPGQAVLPTTDVGWQSNIISPATSTVQGSSIATKLKTIFFQLDYDAMYSGAVIHSKDNIDNDSLMTSDNCSSALSILEVDGLYEKEKINRLANPVVNLHGRYDSFEQMNNKTNALIPGFNNKLGAVLNDNVVIYHRQYSIFDDCVICNFVGSYDYVLKDYFTTVFAKYRTYSYASYVTSINRTEVDKYSVTLSLDRLLFDAESLTILEPINLLSAFSQSNINELELVFDFPYQINGGYLSFDDGNQYFVDVNVFSCGYSLCFNSRMPDPLTIGEYINSINCFSNTGRTNYVGSAQEWYKMPVNSESDGFLQNVGFYFGHFEDSGIVKNNIVWDGSITADELYSDILKLPLKNREPTFSFGKDYAYCKDNKEIIDYTLQYEIINYDNDDILMSEWVFKLTDFNNYIKTATKVEVSDKTQPNVPYDVYFSSIFLRWTGQFGWGTWGNEYLQSICIRVKDEDVASLTAGCLTSCTSTQPYLYIEERTGYWYYSSITLKKIKAVTASTMTLSVNLMTVIQTFTKKVPIYQNDVSLTFDVHHSVAGYTDYWFSGYLFEYISDAPRYCSRNGYEIPNIGYAALANLNSSNSEIKSNVFTLSGSNVISFPQTMYVLLSDEPLKQSLVYAQYKLDDLPATYHISQVDFNDVFALAYDENGRPCIQFKDNAIFQESYASVQYWYYDANGDQYLHFVFGVNAKPGAEPATKKVYTSIVKSRDKKVYNAYHNHVGDVMNYAEEENKDKYGQKQYFVPLEED